MPSLTVPLPDAAYRITPMQFFLFSVPVAALLLAPSVVHAQRSYALLAAPAVRGSLTAGGHVWTVGNPEMVALPGVTHVLPSADFGHLLIVSATRDLVASPDAIKPKKWLGGDTTGRQDETTPGAITLIWWNVRTHRARDVWRRPLAPGESIAVWANGWVGKSGFALFRFGDGKAVRLLLASPTTGQVKEVTLPTPSYSYPNVSPVAPFAALAGADGACEDEVPFVGADGTLGKPVPLPPGTVFFTRWSDDGTALLGVGSAKNADGTTHEQWYAVNPLRRTVLPVAAPPTGANGETVYDDFPDPAEKLPLRLRQDKATGAVLLEAFPAPKTPARVTVSPDGEPVFVLPDGTGLFFRRDGALFFAPLVSAPVGGNSG